MPTDAARPKRQEWNHVPQTPIVVSPLWQWPPKPLAVVRWYFDSWFFITINLMIVAVSFSAFYWASPTIETTRTPGIWIAGIWIRNAVIVSIVAGLLHLWFHKYAAQGTDLKYDPRPFPRLGRMFTFDSQLKDNIFWTIASGVTIWALLESLMWWSTANGYASTITFQTNPIWFVAIFFLIPVWESFYFYWMHRFLHTDVMYRFHALHHRNSDIGPWSGLSMHPVEHAFYFGSVLIHFAIASHPVQKILNLAYNGILAKTTHTGF
jgi:sterol desaturase/sphingolipid hydroxylase (fatty acid hydroxylase superfamily)